MHAVCFFYSSQEKGAHGDVETSLTHFYNVSDRKFEYRGFDKVWTKRLFLLHSGSYSPCFMIVHKPYHLPKFLYMIQNLEGFSILQP